MAYLRNTWYCAGWAEELDDGKHIGRKMLGENVLLYRTEAGALTAMGNICPHRFASLSNGTRHGDNIACPYHGLQFSPSGECVLNPNDGGVIPKKCKVPTYTLVERWHALWIWMGDPDKIDEDLIPDFSTTVEREGWAVVRGHHETHGNYQLVVDNLMDRTHVQFMHPLLKFQGEISPDFKRNQSLEQIGNIVWDYHEELSSPHYALLKPLWPEAPEVIDNYLDVRWEPPGNMLLDSGTVEPGTDRKVGAHMPMANLITPVDENSTHYFWAQARDQNTTNPEMNEKIKMGVAHTFKNEDGAVVADCAQNMISMGLENPNDLMELNPVLLKTDGAAVRARRILASLIEAEAAEE